MAESPRTRRKGVPPLLTLQNAISIAEEIYKKAGMQPIPHDELALIFNNVKSSSSFILKLTALRVYGLMTRVDDDNSKLSDSAKRLFAATNEETERSARLEIFRTPPPFAALHNAYAGQVLPEKKYLINVLEKQGDISPDFYDEWANRFQSEGRFMGIVYNDPKQRAAVRQTAGPMPTAENNSQIPPAIDLPPPPPLKNGKEFREQQEQEFKIPTPSGVIRVYVPQDCAAEDIEIAKGLLDLVVRRMTKEPRNA